MRDEAASKNKWRKRVASCRLLFFPLALALAITASSGLYAEPQPLGADTLYWWTGNDFLNWDVATQAQVATMLASGMQVGMIVSGDTARAQRFYDCVSGWTAGQIGDVIQKWLKDHPEKRHLPLAWLAWTSVVVEACGIKGFSTATSAR